MKITFTEEDWEYLNIIPFCNRLLPAANDCKNGNSYIVDLSIDSWKEVIGFVAAEANHTKDSETEDILHEIFEKIEYDVSLQK